MVKYFQGGYDEAKKYTKGSAKKIQPMCPDCGNIKDKPIKISTIYERHSIGCCVDNKKYIYTINNNNNLKKIRKFRKDGISFPEKLMLAVLEELSIKTTTQKTFDWSVNIKTNNVKLDGYKKYDFYFKLDNEEYVIETHGMQHYQQATGNFKKTLKEEQENDKIKKELALNNGIKPNNYIVIDCRYSTIGWIKKHILNSNLNKLFDLSNIDWTKVEEFATSNLIRTASEIKRKNPNYTTRDIGEIMGYKKGTIVIWLKKGTELGWCNYDAKEEQRKIGKKSHNINNKKIAI